MTNYTNVSARAMLVSLSISMWTGYKMDKKATKQVNDANKAGDKAGRYNKQLLPGAKVFEDLNKRSALARDVHYMNTLPWADEGWRLLPTANFMKYTEAIREQFRLLDALRDEFLATYPDLRDQAREQFTALGELWNARDYPTLSVLRGKFRWSIEYQPVPSSGDIRVELPADELSAIEANITSRVETATRDAMQDAWKRLHEAVARIQKAARPEGIVRNNLLDNARDVVDLIGRLNIAADERLDDFRSRVERELATIAIDDLRKDDATRADAKKRADAIMDAMSAFYTPFEPNGDAEAA